MVYFIEQYVALASPVLSLLSNQNCDNATDIKLRRLFKIDTSGTVGRWAPRKKGEWRNLWEKIQILFRKIELTCTLQVQRFMRVLVKKDLKIKRETVQSKL